MQINIPVGTVDRTHGYLFDGIDATRISTGPCPPRALIIVT